MYVRFSTQIVRNRRGFNEGENSEYTKHQAINALARFLLYKKKENVVKIIKL